MQPHEIDSMLSEYRQNKARHGHITLELARMNVELDAEEERAIINDALHAQQYSDMPHGTDAGKPVETLVMRYLDGYLPAQVKDWMRERTELEREQKALSVVIGYVDIWLNALSDRERQVIEDKLIDGRTWREMEADAQAIYGIPLTVGGLKNIKRRAMQKIYAVAK